MEPTQTARIDACLARLARGEPAARDELLQTASTRLERLARKMLRDSPAVQRWEQTADVLQNALLRLCRALEQVTPPSARDFYRLAALQLRRELVDLARHYYGPQGLGAHHGSQKLSPQEGESGRAGWAEGQDQSTEPSRLALWTEFHEQVDKLPEEQREVFDLLWYQGLTQQEAAAVVGVSDRAIRSRWRDARVRLHEALGGELPD